MLRVRCLWSIVLYCAALCDNALGVGSNSTGAVGFFFRGGGIMYVNDEMAHFFLFFFPVSTVIIYLSWYDMIG